VADDEKIRLELAFEGGQGLTVLVTAKTADEIEHALANPDAQSLGFDAEDGRYTLLLGKVVFAKRYARESRVGFGASA